MVHVRAGCPCVVIHLLPHWSLFSDPYFGSGRDTVSWASMLAALVAALVLAAVALRGLSASDRGRA